MWPSALAQSGPTVYFTAQESSTALTGYFLEAGWSAGAIARRTWSFALPPGEVISGVVRSDNGARQ